LEKGKMRHRFVIPASKVIWPWLLAFAMAFLQPIAARAQDAHAVPKDQITILAFGDSLMAGYQIPLVDAFPAQLQAALRKKGYSVRVINASVSGNTAAHGLERLDWSLGEKVDAAIVEFGANEALLGQDPVLAERALDQILAKLKERGIEVLLAGMESPRNWGADYANRFRAIYPRLAAKHGVLFYPFFLKDVAMNPRLNLPDGLHPTPEGVAVMVRNILPDVEKLIAKVKAKHASHENRLSK
jgi:acyl-CoA thioesterase-1